MLQTLGKSSVLLSSFVFMSVMFVMVMLFVNPAIDGGTGSGVLELQLSFDKKKGIELIKSWGEPGVSNFKNWIFTDFIYALSYSLFFASLISYLTLKKVKGVRFASTIFVSLALLSGALDCVENSMELSFVIDPYGFSKSLFFLHSIVATLKWLAVASVLVYIFLLLAKKDEAHS